LARAINRDVQRRNWRREIYAFFPGQAIMGHRFRKLYVGSWTRMPASTCHTALRAMVRGLRRGTMFRNQYSTLLQHIITDTDSL
jgi:hypothetical protein